MSLPAESHREYYRSRVNSRRSQPAEVAGPRSPCTPGSRWHNFAFTLEDVKKQIRVTNRQIFVDGSLRTDIDPTYAGNGLAAPSVCSDVHLKGKTCQSEAHTFKQGKCKLAQDWVDS